MFDFFWDLVILPHMQPDYSSLRGSRREPTCYNFKLFIIFLWPFILLLTYFLPFNKPGLYFFLLKKKTFLTNFQHFALKNNVPIKYQIKLRIKRNPKNEIKNCFLWKYKLESGYKKKLPIDTKTYQHIQKPMHYPKKKNC